MPISYINYINYVKHIMKKIFLSLMLALPVLFVGCRKEEIVFEHEKPQFELKENAILLEVIVPAGTSAKDQIYMVGAFNGQDTINYVNADFCLQKAEKVDAKYGIYLYPEDFKDGKTLADGFLFVSKLQGIEKPAVPHILDNCEIGNRYTISITAWGGAAQQPEIKHDGYAVFVLDETGWDALTLYMWGDVNDLNGGWPGMPVTGTQTVNGVTYKYFDMGEANRGKAENLIFNNNGGGVQLKDVAYTIDRDTFLILTANGARGLDAEPVPTPEPAEEVSCTVYVENATGWNCFTVYSWGNDYEAFGAWPGMTGDATEEIDGITYYVFHITAPEGNTLNLIFNNNACETEETAKAQYDAAAVTVAKDAVFYFHADPTSATQK